jgi:type II secretory pathway component PulM
MATQDGGGLRTAVEAMLDTLTPRDRKLLMGLAGFFSIVIVAVMWFTLRGALEDKASKVRTAKDNLELVQAMNEEYLIAAHQIEQSESRIRQYQDTAMSAYVESVARTTGVQEQLMAVNEQGSEDVGTLRQTQYRVDLKKVSLQSAVEFVDELERSGYPLHVDVAKFKTISVAGEKQIDLSLELIGFTLVESE